MKSAYRNLFLIFGLAAIVLMLCTFPMDYKELWDNIHRAGYWFFAVIGVWIVIYFFNALSWYAIIRGGESSVPIPFWKIYKLSISGFALNYATPFGLMGGEPYRIMELSPYIGSSRATSSVILYVMMHVFSHICFWLASIVLFLSVYQVESFAVGLFLAVTGVILLWLVYFFMRGYRNGMVVKTVRILSAVPFLRKRTMHFYESKKSMLRKIDTQIAQLHGQRKSAFYTSFLFEFISRTLTSAEIFFILKILTPEVSFIDCILIMAFTSLFSNLFFFSPMQLGAREGGFALVVSGLCLSGAFGVYASLISRVRELIWIVIGVALMKVGNGRRQPAGGLLLDYGGTLDAGGRHWSRIIWEGYQVAAVPVSYERFREAYVHGERWLAQHPVILPSDNFLDLMRKKISVEMDFLNLPSHYVEPVANYCYDYARKETDKSREVLNLYKGKIPMVMVTNFYGNMHSVLEDFGLLSYFDQIVESAVVGVRKPSPDIWRRGVEALKIPAEKVWAVGDAYSKDILPAHEIGCHTIWFEGEGWDDASQPIEGSEADAIIHDITELPAVLPF